MFYLKPNINYEALCIGLLYFVCYIWKIHLNILHVLGAMSDAVDGFHDPIDSDTDDKDQSVEDSFELQTEHFEDELLMAARNGYSDKVNLILSQCGKENSLCDINYKGNYDHCVFNYI